MQAKLKNQDISFTDHAVATAKPDHYVTIDVDVSAVLNSWKDSLFAFEWMNKDGSLKTLDDMPLAQRQSRLDIENDLKAGKGMTKPVLGIGMLGGVEIGAGKAVFLTLAALGHNSIPVHVLKADQDELEDILSK
ncbi:MAG: hypothetical protein AAF569_05130 [Pseudomonadota bacterium]